MPRVKSSLSSATSQAAPKTVSRRPAAVKKSAVKTLHPKKKSKSVLVDVIEDEPLSNRPFPSDVEAAAKAKAGKRPAGFAGQAAEEEEVESEAPEVRFIESSSVAEGKSTKNDEIDNQKKFFSSLVSEIKDREGEVPASAIKAADGEGAEGAPKKSVHLYRRFVIKFLILAGILAAVVLYFSFSKLVVSVTLNGEAISDSLLLKVAKDNSQATDLSSDPREAVSGVIKEIEAQASRSYESTGEEFGDEEISGEVRIINESTKSQALVATTRILSPDNKLYRIKEAVNVPAGGEAKVAIYAEKPSQDLAINPTNFTIPGLWVGLQDKIYAKSDQAFVFEQQIKKYIKLSDIERATQEINEALLDNARQTAEADGSAGGNWFYVAGSAVTVSLDSKAGEAKENFSAAASGKIIAVSFSSEEASKLAAAKLNLLIPDDKELINFDPTAISYALDNYDAASGTATIKADFSGTMILKSDAEVLNRRQLVNLSAAQLETYLKSQPEIKDYRLTFSPSFVKKAPGLADRIKIEVSK